MTVLGTPIRLWPHTDGGRFLAWMLGSFGVVFAVNGVFIWLALSTWSGLVTDHPYEKGLAYNQTLQEAKAEAALGWHSEFDFKNHRLLVRFHDHAGMALDRLRVEARFVRPASDGADQVLPLEATGNGGYAGSVTLPLPGQWDVLITAEGRAGTYHLARRLMAP